MAIQVKVDTQDFPGIISMLGLAGSNALPAGAPVDAAPDASEPPPVDPSLGGASDLSVQPASSLDLGTGEVLPPKNKLQTLRDFLNPAPDVPVPPLQVPGQAQELPPADLATSEAAGTAHIKPTFREAHPLANTLLRVALGVGQGGLIGSQFANAGEAFQAAKEATDPIRKKMEDAALAEKQAATAHQKAVTAQMGSQVTLPNGLTVPLALAQKLYPTLLTEQGKDRRAQAALDSKESIALRNKGLKLDENGKQVPIPYEELTPGEQAKIDLQQSQQDYAAARAQYEKTKGDPNSQAFQLAMERMKTARMNAQTALGRLQLGKLKYQGDYLGTGADGQALPSAPADDNGNPIGLKTAQITKPTNATRSKAEQAGVIKQQGEDILKQIDANPDIYGVVAGRWNEFNAGKFGNASQEVRDAYTSLKSFAALQPALHGARGIGMMKEFEDAVGSMGNDPEGLKGSIQSLLRTSTAFQKAGTMKTVPPKTPNQPAATHVYDPSTGIIAPVK